APVAAAADADLVFARQVVILRIVHQHPHSFSYQGRGVIQLVRVKAGQGTSGDVARHVATGCYGGQSGFEQGIEHLGQILDRDPMELDVLAHRNVGNAAGKVFRKSRYSAQLAGIDEPAGEPDTQHKVRRAFTLAAASADRASAIPLGINAPPAQVSLQPLVGYRGMSAQGEAADLLKALPWVLLSLEPFGPLGFGLFYWCCRYCAHVLT